KKRKLDGVDVVMSSPPPAARLAAQVDRPEYQIPTTGRQKMIRYLVEFILQLNERYPLPSTKVSDPSASAGPPWLSPQYLCKKSMALLGNLLQPRYWGDLEVDALLDIVEGALTGEKAVKLLALDPSDKEKYDEKVATNVVNALHIVRILVNFKPDEWI